MAARDEARRAEAWRLAQTKMDADDQAELEDRLQRIGTPKFGYGDAPSDSGNSSDSGAVSRPSSPRRACAQGEAELQGQHTGRLGHPWRGRESQGARCHNAAEEHRPGTYRQSVVDVYLARGDPVQHVLTKPPIHPLGAQSPVLATAHAGTHGTAGPQQAPPHREVAPPRGYGGVAPILRRKMMRRLWQHDVRAHYRAGRETADFYSCPVRPQLST